MLFDHLQESGEFEFPAYAFPAGTFPEPEQRARMIAVTSGKGGVGKTSLVVNLAIAMQSQGAEVTVLDGDFGLSNVDVVLGLTPQFHLGHVIFGDKDISDILLSGPGGIHVIPASSGIPELSELTSLQRRNLMSQLEPIVLSSDFLLIDNSAGISRNSTQTMSAADEVIVVTTPEPTSVVDAYATIKIATSQKPSKKISLVINQVRCEAEALRVLDQIRMVTEQFLGREIGYLGCINSDPKLRTSVMCQVPVTLASPESPSSRCFHALAKTLIAQSGKTLRGHSAAEFARIP